MLPKRVLLRCKHATDYPYPYPVVGDEVYCRHCGDYSIVESTVDEYRVRCGGCTLSRSYGRDLALARNAANKHSAKTDHTVSIWDGGEVLETVQPSEAQQELPLPGRTGVRPEHQQRLKMLLNRDHPKA